MLKKFTRIFAVTYLSYLGVSVFVLLPALNVIAPRIAEEALGRPLSAKIIFFNPFLLSVGAHQVELPEQDGTQFLSLSEIEVDLSLASLWRQGWVLDRVVVQGLDVRIERKASGQFNFQDILDRSQKSPQSDTENASLPDITIGELSFDAHGISLTDHARDTPFSTRYEGLVIQVSDLSTVFEEGKPYRIIVRAEDEGELEWSGIISLPKSESSGRVTLTNISLQTLSRFAQPWINFEIDKGQLDVSGDYNIRWAGPLHYQVKDASLGITRVNVRPKDIATLPDTSIALESLTLGSVSVDNDSHHINAGDLIITGLEIAGWSENQKVSLESMLLPTEPAAEDQQPTSAPNAKSPKAQANHNPWRATLSSAQLINNQLQWRSQLTNPSLMVLSPINAQLQNLSWPLTGESSVQLSVEVNATSEISIDGSLGLAAGTGTLNYSISNLLLNWFNPSLPKALKATINDGSLTLSGTASLDKFAPVQLESDGTISHFEAKVAGDEETLASWESLRWDNLQLDLDQQAIALKRLSIHNYFSRIHIAQDGTVNVQKVWQQELTQPPQEAADEPAIKRNPWQVNIPQIAITQSAIAFVDESLTRPFQILIGDLSGEIRDISSVASTSTSIAITGSADGYAPIALSGSAKPLLAVPAMDLKLAFDDIDMTSLSPYSGTYAGRTIEGGTLGLNLKYSLSNSRLQGDNSVVVKSFEFGEPVASEKAADLPLDLALALLTDANGVIDLSVPVSGDIDNPTFNIGTIISGAFLNLITKAITSPFALLATLVDSETDLELLRFAPGSSELPKAGADKLAQLYNALKARPTLTLLITGRLNLATDRAQLQTIALNTQLRSTQGLSEKQIASRSPEYLQAIENRYQQLSEHREAEPSLSRQLTRVLQSVEVSDAQLLQLAQDRALQIKAYLVNELGMDPERAAVAPSNLKPTANTMSGVELGVKL